MLAELVSDGNIPNFMVCKPHISPGCWDHYDPMRLPPRPADRMTLPFYRPDQPLTMDEPAPVVDLPPPDFRISVDKALAYVKAQAMTRTPFVSSTLTPFDPTANRHYAGPWQGTFSVPAASTSVPASPVMVTGPLWFPLVAGQPADFNGRVDAPFASMDGWSGRRDMVNPSPPPPTITDPSSVYANGGTNWGHYSVRATVGGVVEFIASVGANGTWSAHVALVPSGQWEFQLVTYANQADAAGDTNRILVGNPWREAERPGDVRTYWGLGYTSRAPQFTGVVLTPAGANNVVAGTLQPFTALPGRTYQILVTNEADVEYCWALQPVAGAGPFTITRPSYQAFGGAIKLRLVEQINGCSVNQIGPVWAQENAADAGAYADLRIEYVAITNLIPTFPASIQPAQLDRTWTVTATGGGAVGRVSLVDVNTKRVLGMFTMPSGLVRSFNVPAKDSGQTVADVYYDGFLDNCFLYDQAVALIAFLQMGEQTAAAAMVDALLTVQNPDGSFPFSTGQSTLYQHNANFIRNGAVAWVIYALLLADQPAYATWFPGSPGPAARGGLDFILGYRNALGTINGGKGQYVGGVLDPTFVVPWWSVEHNIDSWWALDLAGRLYGTTYAPYATFASTIQSVMLTNGGGWDPSKGIFWQGGTVSGGINTPDGMHALDTHTWGAALLQKWGRIGDANQSIARADSLYYVTDPATQLKGYTTFIPQDGYPPTTVKTPWYEGSFGAVVAKRGSDQAAADAVMTQLVRAQRPDGSYLYALQADPVNDIHPWPCTIAPAWSVLAYSGAGTPNARVLWPLT